MGRELVREEVGYEEGRAFNCFSVFSVQCDIVPVIEYNFGTGGFLYSNWKSNRRNKC